MEISEIRRVNLKVLVKKYNNQAGLASMIGMAASQLSPLVIDKDNKNSRNIGEKLARKIERKLSLEKYYLDKINKNSRNSDMSELITNLKRLMSEDEIIKGNQTELARQSGANQPTIKRILSGEIKNPKDNTLKPITDYFGISIPELKGQTKIKSIFKLSKNITRIPKLSATASMGYGVPDNLEHDIQIEGVDLSMSWIRNKLQTITGIKNLRIITSLGDSMSGTFENGDAVFVDTGIIELTVDGVYVIRHDGELFIKRVSRLPFGKYKIKSDNDKYETFVISKKDKTHFQIIGKVVGSLNFNTI